MLRTPRHSFPGLVRSDSSGGDAGPRKRSITAEYLESLTADEYKRYCHATNQWPERNLNPGKNPERREAGYYGYGESKP